MKRKWSIVVLLLCLSGFRLFGYEEGHYAAKWKDPVFSEKVEEVRRVAIDYEKQFCEAVQPVESSVWEKAKAGAYMVFVGYMDRNEEIYGCGKKVVLGLNFPHKLEKEDILRASGSAVYLYLAGSVGAWKGDEELFEEVLNKAESLGKELFDARVMWYYFHKNNWGIRQYGAVALLGDFLSQTEDPAHRNLGEILWKSGFERFKKHFSYQHTPDGGYAEGPGYWVYSMLVALPLYETAKGRGEDLSKWRDFSDTVLWAWNLTDLDGKLPPVDDSNRTDYDLQCFLNYIKDPFAIWTVRNFEFSWEPVYSFLFGAELRDSGKVPTPHRACSVYPDSGDCVIRDFWGGDFYLHFSADSKLAVKKGGGHQQDDSLSIYVEAFHEPVLLDGGYGKWTERNRVAGRDHHTTVSYEGLKEKVYPAEFEEWWLLNGFTSTQKVSPYVFRYVSARSRIGRMDAKRSIVFLPQQCGYYFLVVRDELRAGSDDKFVFYQVLGEVEKKGDDELLVKGKNGDLYIKFIVDKGEYGGVEVDETEWAVGYGKFEKHPRIKFTVRGKEVEVFTVLIFYKKGLSYPKCKWNERDNTFSFVLPNYDSVWLYTGDSPRVSGMPYIRGDFTVLFYHRDFLSFFSQGGDAVNVPAFQVDVDPKGRTVVGWKKGRNGRLYEYVAGKE